MLLVNLFATVHVVWFYLTRTECYIKLPAYEQGLERTPFQHRMLLMAPLRWAHSCGWMRRVAAWLTTQHAWFPGGVRPEGIVEAVIDLASVIVAGLVARELYRRSSRTGLLTPLVYPLTLVMVLTTYSYLTIHVFRFLYDLPGMALFSIGVYLIYTQRHAGWLAALFLIATVNRETSILLLLLFVLERCNRGSRAEWRHCIDRQTLQVVLPLLAAWVGWHFYIAHHFRANRSLTEQHVSLNLVILAVPFAWPQLMSVFGYLLPVVLARRRQILDNRLRSWLWVLPAWFALMLYYGVFVEIRIFGELIPYIACLSALIAEQEMLAYLARRRASPEGSLPATETPAQDHAIAAWQAAL